MVSCTELGFVVLYIRESLGDAAKKSMSGFRMGSGRTTGEQQHYSSSAERERGCCLGAGAAATVVLALAAGLRRQGEGRQAVLQTA